MSNAIIDRIAKEIENFEHSSGKEEIGTVRAVGDGIAEIEGLSGVALSEMVLFETGDGKKLEEALAGGEALIGLVLNLEEDIVKTIVLGDSARIKEGMAVKRMGKLLSIGVSDDLIGRVVNPLGEVLDGRGAVKAKKFNPIEREAYGVIDRSSVDTPLQTGIKMIDALIPIGRGQRELIIGDRVTGKTTVAIDTILNQKNEPEATRPICIYVAIGQKDSKTARIVQQLKEAGAMDYTIVVSASSSAPAALQFLAPYAGAAIGEYFMEQGKDALVIYDDLSKQAVAYRQLSLLLRRPPGREAYPGDIFYLHSRLLERAAKLSKEKGGGSLTALPIIETQENDVSAYIPTNVISITDGQIYLEADLFNKGTRPAMNVGISVSRVGSAAQTKAMKKVAGKIKLELAQFRELEAFMQFSSDLDVDTKMRIEKGQRLSAILNQNKGVPMAFEREVVVIYAAVNGMLDSIPVARMQEAEAALLSYLDRESPKVLESIRTERAMSEDTEAKLKEAIAAFAKSFS